jgi:hypothetical protein
MGAMPRRRSQALQAAITLCGLAALCLSGFASAAAAAGPGPTTAGSARDVTAAALERATQLVAEALDGQVDARGIIPPAVLAGSASEDGAPAPAVGEPPAAGAPADPEAAAGPSPESALPPAEPPVTEQAVDVPVGVSLEASPADTTIPIRGSEAADVAGAPPALARKTLPPFPDAAPAPRRSPASGTQAPTTAGADLRERPSGSRAGQARHAAEAGAPKAQGAPAAAYSVATVTAAPPATYAVQRGRHSAAPRRVHKAAPARARSSGPTTSILFGRTHTGWALEVPPPGGTLSGVAILVALAALAIPALMLPAGADDARWRPLLTADRLEHPG